MISLRAGSASDVGRVRTTNQDRLLVTDGVFAVADGMGGHAAGEVAAQVAVTALASSLPRPVSTAEEVAAAGREANRAVWNAAQADSALRGMGTTLVALAALGRPPGPRLAVINIGDSRLYRLRHGQLEQLTEDHSLVAELVAEGRIDETEAEVHPHRNVLTRALGVDPDVDVDLSVVGVEAGDRYVLCSDGLYRELSNDQIAAGLRRLADPGDAARTLVEEALDRGGSDNITVVVVDAIDDTHPSAADDDADATDTAADTDGTESSLDRDSFENRAPLDHPGAPGPSPPGTGTPSGAVVPPLPAGARPLGSGRVDTPRARLLTFRVVAFVVAMAVILGAGFAAVAVYARDSYFVGLHGDHLAVFQGRPGGVLWFSPTVVMATAVTTAQVEPIRLPQLQAGQPEPSVSAARAFIGRLLAEQRAASTANQPPSPTTAPPSTTLPAGSTTVPGGSPTTAGTAAS